MLFRSDAVPTGRCCAKPLPVSDATDDDVAGQVEALRLATVDGAHVNEQTAAVNGAAAP